MKKGLVLALLTIFFFVFLFLLGCLSGIESSPTSSPSSEEIQEKQGITSTPPVKESAGLGDLCSTEQECREYCIRERPRCESYCRGQEIELCKILFPPVAGDHGPQDNRGCTGSGAVMFTSPPMKVEDVSMIEPYGLMIGGHVTPIDHGYYTSNKWVPGTERKPDTFADVLAPAAGDVQVYSMPSEFRSSTVGDYRLVLYHTCTFYTIYIHVNQLSAKLQEVADKERKAHVEAGEVIGRAPGFDFSVHNDEITLSGFVVPETYIAEPWKLHNVDMFGSFVEPIRTQLLDKNVRQKEPRSGKIDYDIDGKLVGNWFEENTNGYMGKEEYRRSVGYWSTHLAFAYDGLDPDTFVVSMGDYGGEAKQFAVKGNALDPQDVEMRTGLVKYELVTYDYETEDGHWDRLHFGKVTKTYRNDDLVEGVVLVEMLETRKIKFESFPGKKASEVSGFTPNAIIYER